MPNSEREIRFDIKTGAPYYVDAAGERLPDEVPVQEMREAQMAARNAAAQFGSTEDEARDDMREPAHTEPSEGGEPRDDRQNGAEYGETAQRRDEDRTEQSGGDTGGDFGDGCSNEQPDSASAAENARQTAGWAQYNSSPDAAQACAAGVSAAYRGETDALAPDVRYGGFFPRLGAYLVDSVLAGIISGIVNLLFGLITPNTGLLFSFTAADIAGYLAFTGYFVMFLCLIGSTPGKRLFKLRVVKSDGQRVRFFDALYRETIGRYLNSLLCIGYIVLMADVRKRSFADMLCDTRVIYDLK